MTPEDFNPELNEPLTPEEQEQIANLSPEQMEQVIEQALMPLDPADDGYDAAQGVFRPEHPRWRTFIEGGTIKWRSRLTERRLEPVHVEANIKALQNAYILDPEPYVKESLTESTLCWYPDNSAIA